MRPLVHGLRPSRLRYQMMRSTHTLTHISFSFFHLSCLSITSWTMKTKWSKRQRWFFFPRCNFLCLFSYFFLPASWNRKQFLDFLESFVLVIHYEAAWKLLLLRTLYFVDATNGKSYMQNSISYVYAGT